MNEYRINLEKKYNHQAVMGLDKEIHNMEYSCGIEGKFFEVKTLSEICSNNTYIFDGINFLMPDFKRNEPDNLICEEQEIQIEKKGFYSAAYIIGLSECGEFGGWNGICENLNLIYHDNSIQKAKIFFFDWWRGEGKFEFEPEINCKLAISATDNNGVNRYIYCCRIDLNKEKELSSIHLPYNPCIHIFSITLC